MAKKKRTKPTADRSRAGDDEKRRRRLERKEQEEAARRSAERRRRLRVGVIGAVVVVAAGAGVWYLARPDPEVAGVERVANRGREHVPAEQVVVEDPAPASGDHPPGAPPCGATTTPLDPGLSIHALEHGAVVVWYRPDVDPATVDELRNMLDEWDSHWILSPNSRIGDPIVAVAWTRRMSFDSVDDTLHEFVDTYRRRGPERVDCPA